MSLNLDYNVEVSCDDDFTVVVIRNLEGANLARYSFEHELVPVILAALMGHLGVEGDDELIHFFPLCDDCPCENECLVSGRCFLEAGADCEL